MSALTPPAPRDPVSSRRLSPPLRDALAALATLGVEPTSPGVADAFVVVDADTVDVPPYVPRRTTVVLVRAGSTQLDVAQFVERLISRRGHPPEIAASLVAPDRTRAVVAPLDTVARLAGVIADARDPRRAVLVIGDVVVDADVARRAVVGGLRVERTGLPRSAR